MSRVRETPLTVFIMYLSPLTSEVYCLVNLFEKPVHNAIRHFSYFIQDIFFLFCHENIHLGTH